MKPGYKPKVHGPGIRISELFCGNEWTENSVVSDNKALWSCERCISKGLRAEIAQLRAASIQAKEVIAGK